MYNTSIDANYNYGCKRFKNEFINLLLTDRIPLQFGMRSAAYCADLAVLA